MADLNLIIEQLSKLTLIEAADLVKALEEKWGDSAAPVAVAGPAVAAAPVAEEKTEFKVTLESAGDKKIDVIKIVREITALGLKEAKDLVDGAPKVIKDGISKDAAEKMKQKFEAVGAKVKVE